MGRGRVIACGALAVAACTSTTESGSFRTTTTTTTVASPHQLQVSVHESRSGVGANDVDCSYDGERQLLASGVVRNGSAEEVFVSIEVRFVDARGVRVELATDSVSALQSGESARWDVGTYPAGADEAVGCVVSVDAS